MYTTINFKTKKALKEAVASGEQITVYQPGPFASDEPINGKICIEGPHYPEPHRWYASAVVKDSIIIKITG